MMLFNSKKSRLLEWQKLIIQDSPNKLIVSEKQLEKMTAQQTASCIKIINDCMDLLSTTNKPTVFFSRLDLLKENAKKLASYEKYIKFQGASPSLALQEVERNEQTAIHEFLVRYFNNILDKVESLKTEKAKRNQFQKFYESLLPYYNQMDKNNRDYVETKFHAYSK